MFLFLFGFVLTSLAFVFIWILPFLVILILLFLILMFVNAYKTIKVRLCLKERILYRMSKCVIKIHHYATSDEHTDGIKESIETLKSIRSLVSNNVNLNVTTGFVTHVNIKKFFKDLGLAIKKNMIPSLNKNREFLTLENELMKVMGYLINEDFVGGDRYLYKVFKDLNSRPTKLSRWFWWVSDESIRKEALTFMIIAILGLVVVVPLFFFNKLSLDNSIIIVLSLLVLQGRLRIFVDPLLNWLDRIIMQRIA